MKNEMLKRLSDFVGTDTLISIYTDIEAPDSFMLGYLLNMDNHYALVNMVDRFGEENGFSILDLNNIFIFETNKMYSGKIQKLFKLKKQIRRCVEDSETSPVISFLKYAVSNKCLIEVNSDDDCIGYVTSFSKEILVLHLYDNYCNDMGAAIIDIKNVNMLECETRYLKDLELLACNYTYTD